MGEIKAKAVRGDERALLVDILAENVAKGVVEQVRRGMVGENRGATIAIDLEAASVPDIELPIYDLTDVQDIPAA